MATFADKEAEEAQQVVELYIVTAEDTSYYLTSANRDVTYGGNVYKSAPIQRGEISREAKLSAGQLTITLYALTDVIRKYIATSPASKTYITIRRVHVDDVALPAAEVFAGYISGVAFSGSQAQVTCASIFSALKYPIPTIYHQRACNWNLFDTRCTVSITAAQYHLVGTAAAGSLPHLITVAGLSAFGATFFEGGFAELKPDAVDDGTIDGEVRLIVKQAGNVITMQFAFSVDDLVGRYIGVYAGCNKSWSACGNKFGNRVNFGGFPWIPKKNPATTPPDQVESL